MLPWASLQVTSRLPPSYPQIRDDHITQTLVDMGLAKEPEPEKCNVIGCHEDIVDERHLCEIHYDTYCSSGIRTDCCLGCNDCRNTNKDGDED
jgi:hypothetical protein